jgi:polysaccharide export outer membrane protein
VAALLLLANTLSFEALAQTPAGVQDPQADRPTPAEVSSIHDQQAGDDPAGFQLWSSGRYRLTPTDVIELTFPYVPEFNQVITVQPDGYITLQAVGELRVQSRSLPELRQMLTEAYAPILRDPVITIVLKEFEKPYFVATGEVAKPGKFDLRSATTISQALAFAGGMTRDAKHSQVILFRRYSADYLEVKEINVKKMLNARDLSEDMLLRPGDTLFVPRNAMSKFARFIPTPGLFFDPVAMFR